MRLRSALILTAILGCALMAPAQAKPDREDRQDRHERIEKRNDNDNDRDRENDRARSDRDKDRQSHRGRSDRRSESGERRHSRKGVLTRDEAARRAQQRYGGRVLSVDLLQSDSAPARYRIKLLSDGNVRTVDVNALED